MDHFYFVANRLEGCGHRHRKKRAAQQCQRFLNRRGWKARLYVWYRGDPRARPASPHSTQMTTRTWDMGVLAPAPRFKAKDLDKFFKDVGRILDRR